MIAVLTRRATEVRTELRSSIHLERLVLDGLPVTAAQGARVRKIVERELAHLVTAGLPGVAHGGAVAKADAGTIPLRLRDTADAIGKRIARSTYRRIGGGTAPGEREQPEKVRP